MSYSAVKDMLYHKYIDIKKPVLRPAFGDGLLIRIFKI